MKPLRTVRSGTLRKGSTANTRVKRKQARKNMLEIGGFGTKYLFHKDQCAD